MRDILFLSLAVILMVSCKKETTKPAMLIYPQQNEVCTQGRKMDDKKSSVLFKWHPSVGAKSYIIEVTNIYTGEIIQKESELTEIDIVLNHSTAYSWQVFSRSTKKKDGKSELFKFYIAGTEFSYINLLPVLENYPAHKSSVYNKDKINISWIEKTMNERVKYDFYFGTQLPLPLLKENLNEKTVTDISIKPGRQYFWKVVSKDNEGNSVESSTFQFSVF